MVHDYHDHQLVPVYQPRRDTRPETQTYLFFSLALLRDALDSAAVATAAAAPDPGRAGGPSRDLDLPFRTRQSGDPVTPARGAAGRQIRVEGPDDGHGRLLGGVVTRRPRWGPTRCSTRTPASSSMWAVPRSDVCLVCMPSAPRGQRRAAVPRCRPSAGHH